MECKRFFTQNDRCFKGEVGMNTNPGFKIQKNTCLFKNGKGRG